MPSFDLRHIDLDLLLVLDVLLRERSVSRSGEKIGRSQPATSHALARLRKMLGDPLLVNVHGQMQPTPRAEQIGPELGRILESLRRLLTEKNDFDPSCTTRIFRFAAPGLIGTFLPGLMRVLRRDAPQASLEARSLGPSLLADLAQGIVEVVLGPARPWTTDGVCTRRLGAMPWAVFARADHPATKRWCLAEWARWPHVRVTMPSADASPVDEAAKAASVERRTGLIVSHMLEVPPILATTDMLFTTVRGELPNSLDAFGLVAMTPPVDLPPLAFALYWSAHLTADPAALWLRTKCIEVFTEILRASESLPALPLVTGERRR